MASSNTPSETSTSQEQGLTPDATSETQKNSNRGKTDLAWGHCKQLIRGGGINWVKHHLAGKGGDIEACRKMPAVIFEPRKEKVKKNMQKVIMLVMKLKENLMRLNQHLELNQLSKMFSKDIRKLEEVSEIVSQASMITKYTLGFTTSKKSSCYLLLINGEDLMHVEHQTCKS
ncbi:hypothetical protein AHAS_Ahas07G0090100 [Arachis hypogaea]